MTFYQLLSNINVDLFHEDTFVFEYHFLNFFKLKLLPYQLGQEVMLACTFYSEMSGPRVTCVGLGLRAVEITPYFYHSYVVVSVLI